MLETMEYDRSSKRDIGICIQNTGKKASVVEAKVENKISVEECFDKSRISKEMYKDPEDLKLFSTAVKEWILLKKEYELLSGCIGMMKPEDRYIFLPYIKKEKSLDDLAGELFLEKASVSKRIYRIKKNLAGEILPWLKDYK